VCEQRFEEAAVGFSGHLVFGRSERAPLLDAPVFDQLHPEAKATTHAWRQRTGGWQTLRLDYDIWEDEYLEALVTWTEAPACVAEVYDSDVATVTGLDPAGQRWRACLNLETAAGLWAAEPDDVDDQSVWVTTPEYEEAVARKRAELEAEVAPSARGARAWAAAAGFAETVTLASIEEVLRSHAVFVEELFAVLLDRLGFPDAEGPERPS
jgi:hypothetical protein